MWHQQSTPSHTSCNFFATTPPCQLSQLCRVITRNLTKQEAKKRQNMTSVSGDADIFKVKKGKMALTSTDHSKGLGSPSDLGKIKQFAHCNLQVVTSIWVTVISFSLMEKPKGHVWEAATARRFVSRGVFPPFISTGRACKFIHAWVTT